MKLNSLLLAFIASITIALTACDGSGASVDTSRLTSSFSSAEAGLKSSADAAATAIKKGDYNGALTQLQSLAGNAKITDEQKKAVADVIEQVKKAMADMAAKASEGAKNALGGLPKSGG
jgi:hypothetical protein